MPLPTWRDGTSQCSETHAKPWPLKRLWRLTWKVLYWHRSGELTWPFAVSTARRHWPLWPNVCWRLREYCVLSHGSWQWPKMWALMQGSEQPAWFLSELAKTSIGTHRRAGLSHTGCKRPWQAVLLVPSAWSSPWVGSIFLHYSKSFDKLFIFYPLIIIWYSGIRLEFIPAL